MDTEWAPEIGEGRNGIEARHPPGPAASAFCLRSARCLLSHAAPRLSCSGRSALPIVTAAHRCRESLGELDRLSDVFLSNPVANRASRAQGRALLTSVARSFRGRDVETLETRIRIEGLAGHYAPLFGGLFRVLGIEMADTQRAYLFISARGVSSAAVRLGIIGAFEAQAMQAELTAHIDAIVRDCGDLSPDDIAQTAPLIDLFQATQDRLYSRLFQS